MWVLLAVAALAIVFFFLTRPEAPRSPEPVAAITPAPATPAPATPEPVLVRATPTPMPVAIATPTPAPTPPALDLATVARSPALWPRQIALLRPVPFPVMLNGRRAGEVTVPAGTVLRLSRVAGQQVEVEYQNSKHLISIASTDLMQRALATFRAAGSRVPDVAPPSVATGPVATVQAPALKPAVASPTKVGEHIGAEVVRIKKSRTEGGDFDDKRDRISLRVKLTNSDTAVAANQLKGEVYIFAAGILDRNVVKLLGNEAFDFSLPPRGSHEFVAGEVHTEFDTTGARFGYRYEGWLLRVRDNAGAVILVKSSMPTMAKNAEKIATLASGHTYDRTTFKEKASGR